VIDIDRQSSWFIFFDGGHTRYCRKEERLGEKQMLSTLDSTISLGAESLRLETDQAKQVVREYGIAERSGVEEITGKKMPLFQIHSMLRPYAELMAAMTRNAISRSVKEFSVPGINSIHLTGYGAYIKGLPQYLEKTLGVPTARLAVMDSTVDEDRDETSLQQADEDFSYPGAAAAQTSADISLLPANIMLKRYSTLGMRIGIFAFIGLFAVLALFYSNMVKQKQRYHQMLSQLDRIQAPESTIADLSDELETTNASLKWYHSAVEQISPPHKWMGILGDVSNIMPADMMLERVVFARDSSGSIMTLAGTVSASVEGARATSLKFAGSLKSSPFVEEVLQVNQKALNQDEPGSESIHFEVKFRLRELPPTLTVQHADNGKAPAS